MYTFIGEELKVNLFWMVTLTHSGLLVYHLFYPDMLFLAFQVTN